MRRAILVGVLGTTGALLSGPVCSSRSAHLPPPVGIEERMPDERPIEISEKLLKSTWELYARKFIQSDGRVIDHKAGGISTSEGQAYAMLRAVWMRDRTTFDLTYAWARNNLNAGTRSDALFAWKWGKRDDGSWGVQDPNSASDASQLIAYALLRAEQLWSEPRYLEEGRRILADFWERETLELGPDRYILAGDWRPDAGPLPLNPSYYQMFLYPFFHQFDPERPWLQVLETGWKVLSLCRSRVGLPVDWCHLDSDTGEIRLERDASSRFSDFGYDAFRVYWNVAAAHRWDQDPRALPLLREMDWLKRYYKVRRELPAVFTVDGVPRASYPSLGLYGALLPSLALDEPAQASLLYHQGIAEAFKDGLWGDPNDYYAQNWVWFGLALHSEKGRP